LALPFSAAQFFEVFARYNRGVWPLQFALAAAALACIALLAAGAVFAVLVLRHRLGPD